MSESDWLASTDPQVMLAFLRASERKLRLFEVACCRRLYPLLRDPVLTASLDTVEQVLEGAGQDDLMAARTRLVEAVTEAFSERYSAEACANFCVHPAESLAEATELAAYAVGRLFEGVVALPGLAPVLGPEWGIEGKVHHLAVCARACAARATATMASRTRTPENSGVPRREPEEVYVEKARWSEMACQTDFLRDIFGSPFKPITFRPEWRTEAVVSLARSIYEERAWGRMGVLADALEEAGCDTADVLTHCRGPGIHTRGCHVLDAAMDRA